jgi:hypothetical protein
MLVLCVVLGLPLSGLAQTDAVIVRFQEGSRDTATAALSLYRGVPKGVVLEGVAEGIEPITHLAYDKDSNEFIINKKMRYKLPIPGKEWVQVYRAVVKDDRMGVTLMQGEPRVYGPLPADGAIIKALVETDMMLGGIIYGIDRLLEGVKLPGNFKPKKAQERKIPVVAFSRFTDFAFEKAGDRYQLASCIVDVQLIPLSEKKTERGGHLPDEAKMEEYVMEDSDRENLAHLRTNQAEYLKIPAIAKSAAAGEAAAFARFVRDCKIDEAALVKEMK